MWITMRWSDWNGASYAFVFRMQQKNKLAYDQEIPQSHTADQPTASWGKATEH